MNTTLFIPSECKVGFNWREDCFSKKLGYVIGKEGNKWRKEQSWNGWIKKPGEKKDGGEWIEGKWVTNTEMYGDEMEPLVFKNIPTEGFVLNKKVGGHSSGWNSRKTYSRVFDPRGFEVEISIQNLLYILEYCNSIRGKALEGEFLYSWDGKDLVLLPANSPDYQSSLDYKTLTAKKLGVKDLVEGHIYFDKENSHYVYLGKRDWYSFRPDVRSAKKQHIFYALPWQEKYDSGYDDPCDGDFEAKNSFSFLKGKVSDVIIDNYAAIFDKFQNNTHSAEVVNFEFTPIDNESIFDTTSNYYNAFQKGIVDGEMNKIISFDIFKHNSYYHYNSAQVSGVFLQRPSEFDITKKTLSFPQLTRHISLEEFKKEKFYTLTAIYSNGIKKKIDRLYDI